jgi:hypothetical protein
MRSDKIVYSINMADLQVVAKVIYGKKLNDEQLEILRQKIGDYMPDWFDPVEFAIDNLFGLEKLEEPDWDEYPY